MEQEQATKFLKYSFDSIRLLDINYDNNKSKFMNWKKWRNN